MTVTTTTTAWKLTEELVTDKGVISWLISYLKMIRVDVLEKFVVPGLDISYWDFIIGLAIAAVVITVLISGVRIGIVSSSQNKDNAKPQSSVLTPKNTTVKMNDGFGGKYTDTYGRSSGGIWVKR